MAYFSNGSEGEVLHVQCAACPVGKHLHAPCPILGVQTFYNYVQLRAGNDKLREAMTMLIDEDGKCQMKPLIEKPDMHEPAAPVPVMPALRDWAKQRGIVVQ